MPPSTGSFWKGQVGCRHCIDEPDAVGGEIEFVSVTVHRAGGHLKDDWLASPRAHFGRGLIIGRKMDVVARLSSTPDTECPWLARIRKPSSLKAKRFLSLLATTSWISSSESDLPRAFALVMMIVAASSQYISMPSATMKAP
ncbi:hypothetical protein Pla52n_38750 [Stieleria varia]|uniref:Uncharacterized protein n=1 Tax=Stieleria varia TaxID=2528005 RepID=A0A5C6AS47_9BACT|nr:hypothetical protein Pla52n_38750 [Stieleria varia]